MVDLAPERRQARDGYAYRAEEFQQYYGHHWQRLWADAAGDVPQLAAAAVRQAVRLDASMLVEIRQRETARGPPRSLHNLARDALNQIGQNPTYQDQDLDELFDWVPYVVAHASCDQIIGPGIAHAAARFVHGNRDHNRGGGPRLDFFFHRTDGTVCRVHPGQRPKNDAQLIFQ